MLRKLTAAVLSLSLLTGGILAVSASGDPSAAEGQGQKGKKGPHGTAKGKGDHGGKGKKGGPKGGGAPSGE
jgi:hypothetical protein